MTEPLPPCVIISAATFAADRHREQVRKNGAGPYINHPLRVADILANEALVEDGATLIAAILHDVLEDTNTTRREIVDRFNEEVANIVAEVTDDKSLSKDLRKRLQVANASKKSKAAKLVKLADKLDNCRDLVKCPPPNWSVDRVRGYFVWTEAVLKGLRGTSSVLEAKLEELLTTGKFPIRDGDGKLVGMFSCLPAEEDKEQCLENYYKFMSTTRD